MRIQNVLLVTLLVALYGCQRETPVQQDAVLAEAASPVSVASTVPVADVVEVVAVSPVPVIAPVRQAETVMAVKPVKEKAAPVKENAVVIAEKGTTHVETVIAPVAKSEPVKVVAEPGQKVEPPIDALALAKKNNCLACHAIDRTLVGPAWKAIAVKYRGDAGAEAHLVNKIAKGGSGVWGRMAMPAYPQISQTDRSELARFVLNLQ